MYDDIKEINEKLTIVVVGYDEYKDVWDNFFYLLNKNWNERPKTILACSELRPHYDGVEIYNAGKDSEWSKKIIDVLAEVKTEYILLLLEDFFIMDKIDNNTLSQIIKLMDDDSIIYYQLLVQLLFPRLGQGKMYMKNRYIHVIPQDKKYPINLQASIWKKEYLHECLGEGNYNAWEFEINHMHDLINKDKVNCVIDDRNVLNIMHGVVQSKYLRGIKKRLIKEGCQVDKSDREELGWMDDFKYRMKLFFYQIVPKRFVKVAKLFGKKLGIDFVTDRIQRTNNG